MRDLRLWECAELQITPQLRARSDSSTSASRDGVIVIDNSRDLDDDPGFSAAGDWFTYS